MPKNEDEGRQDKFTDVDWPPLKKNHNYIIDVRLVCSSYNIYDDQKDCLIITFLITSFQIKLLDKITAPKIF